jgi:hypothetical protein
MAATYASYATQVSEALRALLGETGVEVDPAVGFVSCGVNADEHFVPESSLERHLVGWSKLKGHGSWADGSCCIRDRGSAMENGDVDPSAVQLYAVCGVIVNRCAEVLTVHFVVGSSTTADAREKKTQLVMQRVLTIQRKVTMFRVCRVCWSPRQRGSL